MKAQTYTRLMALSFACLTACNLEVIPDGGASGTFIKTFGTASVVDRGYSIIETSDKKLLLTGEIRGVGSGGSDIFLMKLDSKGQEEWTKPFGGPLDDVGYQVIELSSKSYRITGKYTDATYEKLYSFTTVIDGTVSGFPLKPDIQSDARGAIEVSGRLSYFGTENLCGPPSVCNHYWMFQTDMSGTILGINDGYGSGVNTLGTAAILSKGSGANIFGVGKQYNDNINQYDSYLIRMPNNFVDINTMLAKDFKETANQTLNGLVELADNTFIAVGETENNVQGTSDILLIRFDQNLNLVGSPVKIGGSGIDRANGIIRTSDDKLVIVGETSSKGAGDLDLYLLKVNYDGTIVWDITYGGSFKDGGYAVSEASNGDLLITGYVQNSANASDVDIYVIRANSKGKVQ